MDRKTKKIVGWLLIVLSLGLIIFMMFETFKIFTGKSQPPEIFKNETAVTQQNLLDKKSAPEVVLQEQLQKTIWEQMQNILPVRSMTGMLNLSSWFIFVSIIIFGSSKIAGIGVSLLKE